MRRRLFPLVQALPLLAVALTLLLVVPPLDSAFHAPKAVALLACAAAGALGLALAPTRRWDLAALLPGAALAVSVAAGDASLPWPVVTQAAFALALLAWTPLGVPWARLAQVGALAGAAASAVVLLQAAGLDPLAGFAPLVTGRLGVYGTLGNPDFAASALSVTAWLAAACCAPDAPGPRWSLLRGRAWALVCLGLHLAALAATRSFATVVALAAGVGALAAATRSGRAAVLGLAAVGVVALGLTGRDPGAALRGRWYLAQVAAPHLREAPLSGRGPGAVEVLWPGWEAELWAARCPDAACVAAHPEARFAGLQDHVHLDWLERALEQGLLGLVALLLVLGRGLAGGPALRRAALTTLGVRACFDFPLARPADLALLAALLAVSTEAPRRPA